MNQSQRTFLIKRIEDKTEAQIKALNSLRPDKPSIGNYINSAFLSGEIKIKSSDKLTELLKARFDELGSIFGTRGFTRNSEITFDFREFFEAMPKAYLIELQKYQATIKEIEEKIKILETRANTLSVRIQLASNHTLEKMIMEVDDMGDVSLIDTKIDEILQLKS